MAIVIQCPACQVRSQVPETVSGRSVRCKKCGQKFTVQQTQAGSRSDTKSSQPTSSKDLFSVLPAEFGRYRLLSLLGQGGMGAVYLAEDTQLRRQVALKLPFFDTKESPQRAERFIREAQSAASLHHPNICTVFDTGRIDGRPFLTMAYIQGIGLDRMTDPDHLLPASQVVEIIRKVALALADAHSRGIVHRDLKPANIMLATSGEPVVMDFGLAKRSTDSDAADAKLTRDGGVIGTPSYMSPEQVRGDNSAIGAATDIYSLGVVLYELLAGRTPFVGGMGAVMGQILAAPVPPLTDFRPDADPQLDSICRTAMAKSPADRFASMLAFAQALSKYLTSESAISVELVETPTRHSPAPMVYVPTPSTVAQVTAKKTLSPATAPAESFDQLTDSPPRKKRSTRKQSSNAWIGRGIAIGIALAILGPLVWFGVTLLRVETPNGTLIVEISDEEVEAKIKGGRLVISGQDGKERYTLSPTERNKKIDAGDYKIHVEGADGLTLDTPEFTLKKGDKVTVRVTLEKKDVAIADLPVATVPAKILTRESIPPDVLSSLGGGDPGRAPPDLVAVLGDLRFRSTPCSGTMAISHDGRLVAVPSGNDVVIFNAGSGQIVRRVIGTREKVEIVTFSASNSVLAICAQNVVTLIDPSTGAILGELTGHSGPIWAVAISGDAKTLVTGGFDRTVRLWDLTTKRQVQVWKCAHYVTSVALTPDHSLAFAGVHDGSVHAWSTATRKEQFSLPATSVNTDTGVAVSPDGEWLATGNNEKCQVWKIASLSKAAPLPQFEKNTPAVWLAFEGNSNKLWMAGFGEHVSNTPLTTLDIASGIFEIALQPKEKLRWVRRALSLDGKTLIFGSGEGGPTVLRVYDTQTGKLRFPTSGHTREVWPAVFSPDTTLLASAGPDLTVLIWDLATQSPLHILEGHTGAIGFIEFSPDGSLLASASHDGTISIWSVKTGRRLMVLKGYFYESQIRFTPDGKFIAAGTAEGSIQMWSVRSGVESRQITGIHEGWIYSLSFSPDNKHLATAGRDGKLVVTDLTDKKTLHSFKRKTWPYRVKFSSDANSLAAVYEWDEPYARIWNLKDEDFIQLVDATGKISSISTRADGRVAVTTTHEGTVRLWSIEGTDIRSVVLAHGDVNGRNWSATMSSNGLYVACSNSNGTVQIFRLPALSEDVGKWIDVRSAPPRGLSEEAWLKRVKGLYVGNVPTAIENRLRELNPRFNSQSTPVIANGEVTELYLNEARIEELSPIRALPALQKFECVRSLIKDLSPISGLKLTSINISNTPIVDISALKGMRLTRFACVESQLSNLEPLRGMPLTRFDCWRTTVTDLSALNGAPLDYLDCSETRISDLAPLKGAPIKELHFHHTLVSDLTPLRDMPLTFLRCHNTQISDLTPLEGMKLTDLYLSETQVADLTPLKGMNILKLACQGSRVDAAGLSAVQDMVSLFHLEIGNPKLTDEGLVHIRKLTRLEVLTLYDSKLVGTGLVHLKGLTKLRHLSLARTAVGDDSLDNLKNLTELRELHLHETQVTDVGLQQLTGLKNLEHLFLNRTKVTEKGIAMLKESLPKCNIHK